MSVAELVSRVQSSPELDLKAVRDEIHREADQPCSEEERVILLKLFNAIHDRAARAMSDAPPDQLEQLRNLRLSDYRLLIIKEATIGENVCPETLAGISDREVAAGRMADDDSLRALAKEQLSKPHPSRAELIAIAEKAKAPKRSLFSRLFGK